MAGDKIDVTFTINPDMEQMLKDAMEKYDLPDISKALRCVLDYVIEDGDKDQIFGKIRYTRCIGGPIGRMY